MSTKKNIAIMPTWIEKNNQNNALKNLKTYLKFNRITVLPFCMLSGSQNNHLTSAQLLDKNTNLLWALGILLPHTGACHS